MRGPRKTLQFGVIFGHFQGLHCLRLADSLGSNSPLAYRPPGAAHGWPVRLGTPHCSFWGPATSPGVAQGPGVEGAWTPSPAWGAQVPRRAFPCSSTLSHLRGVKLLKTKPKREVCCRQLLLSAFPNLPWWKWTLEEGGVRGEEEIWG